MRYTHPDALGSLVMMTNASQQPTNAAQYDGFGSMTSSWLGQGQAASATAFKFGGGNGCQTDVDLGLVLMGHRYYDPRTGRFLSQDPAGDGDNWYAYAGNSPTNEVDPDGLSPMDGPGSSPSGFEQSVAMGVGNLEEYVDGGSQGNQEYLATTTTHTWQEQMALGWDATGHGMEVDTGFSVPGSDSWSTSSFSFIAADPFYDAKHIFREVTNWLGITQCFTEGAPVQERGKTKPIQSIHTGEVVATRNLQTGKTEYRRVVRTFKHLAHDTITVQFADAKTQKIVDTLTATPEHPFFVLGRGMTALGRLGIGTLVVTRAGPAVVVHSLVRHHSAAGVFVYNIEVEDDHTYFVGNVGEWVHNACFSPVHQALIELAKEAKAKSSPGKGIPADQAKTLLGWAKDYGLYNSGGLHAHSNKPGVGQFPHIRIGPVNHL